MEKGKLDAVVEEVLKLIETNSVFFYLTSKYLIAAIRASDSGNTHLSCKPEGLAFQPTSQHASPTGFQAADYTY